MEVDADEIGFCLSIEIRKRRGKNVVDITVDEIHTYNHYGDDERKVFTEEELNTVVIYGEDSITFGCESGQTNKTYRFSSNKVTIKEFVDAIIDFEKITRPLNGVIDCHHIFYEGMEQMEENGPYFIHWGS